MRIPQWSYQKFPKDWRKKTARKDWRKKTVRRRPEKEDCKQTNRGRKRLEEEDWKKTGNKKKTGRKRRLEEKEDWVLQPCDWPIQYVDSHVIGQFNMLTYLKLLLKSLFGTEKYFKSTSYTYIPLWMDFRCHNRWIFFSELLCIHYGKHWNHLQPNKKVLQEASCKSYLRMEIWNLNRLINIISS